MKRQIKRCNNIKLQYLYPPYNYLINNDNKFWIGIFFSIQTKNKKFYENLIKCISIIFLGYMHENNH